MEPQTIVAIGGGLVVVANVLIFWIREWKKHQTWKTNGNDLKEIKEDVKLTNSKVDCIDEVVGETKIKIAEIKTAVNAQKSTCKATVLRFDKAISDQGKVIIDLAKRE